MYSNLFLLYIDPGTGSMLFSILIGIVSTFIFLGQRLFMKLKFVISGGKADKLSTTKIPYVIFSDHKRYWNVFKPICDEFEKRETNLVYWTASPDDPALTQEYKYVKAEFIGEGNKAFAKLNMMNAGICISTTPGLGIYQWKRSKNVDYYVHIFHSVSDGTGYRMFGLDNYDAILAGGPIVEKELSIINNKRKLAPKEFVITGITYMDELKARLDKATSSSDEKTHTVLLAPSWGPSAILSKYGEQIIPALLNTVFNIIIRPHPQSLTSEKEMLDALMKKYPDSEKLSWNFENDNFNALNKSSIMISDFSGVIFDYAFVFNKPVIYTEVNFDPSPYDAAWLDDEKWMIRQLPYIGKQLSIKDFEKMQVVLDETLSDQNILKNTELIRSQCWTNIGISKETITDYLIKKNSNFQTQ